MTDNRKKMIKTFRVLFGTLFFAGGLLMLAGAVIAHRHIQFGASQTVFWIFGEPAHYLLFGVVFLTAGSVLIVPLWRRGKV